VRVGVCVCVCACVCLRVCVCVCLYVRSRVSMRPRAGLCTCACPFKHARQSLLLWTRSECKTAFSPSENPNFCVFVPRMRLVTLPFSVKPRSPKTIRDAFAPDADIEKSTTPVLSSLCCQQSITVSGSIASPTCDNLVTHVTVLKSQPEHLCLRAITSLNRNTKTMCDTLFPHVVRKETPSIVGRAGLLRCLSLCSFDPLAVCLGTTSKHAARVSSEGVCRHVP
jgi:hypothetical protein